MSFIDLPDDAMQLAMCIDSDYLQDPAAWCSEFRVAHTAYQSGQPKTAVESGEIVRKYQAVFEKYRTAKAAGIRYGTALPTIESRYRDTAKGSNREK